MSRSLALLAIIAALGLATPVAAAAETPAAPPCDETEARRFYSAAKAAPDAEGAVVRLDQSMTACPTFKAGFQLAKLLLGLERADDALSAARATLPLTPDARATALVRGLLGTIQAKRGEVCDALTAMQEARGVLGNESPKWLESAWRELDVQLADAVIDADTIACILAGRSLLSNKALGVRTRSVNLRVHFAFDSAKLAPDGVGQVGELARALAADDLAGKTIEVIGHTDQQGTSEYNKTLSERRAVSVRNEIAQRKPALASRIRAEGRGENQLLDSRDSESAHHLNRRVEVRVSDGG